MKYNKKDMKKLAKKTNLNKTKLKVKDKRRKSTKLNFSSDGKNIIKLSGDSKQGNQKMKSDAKAVAAFINKARKKKLLKGGKQ